MTDDRGTFANQQPTTPTTNPTDTQVAQQAADAKQAADMAITRATNAADQAAAAKAQADQLTATANTFQTTVATADTLHKHLQDEIDALNTRLDNIQLTPGPTGATAYDIARAHGYGGTETQWLATLRGDPGKDGSSTKGDPGTNGTTPTITIGSVTTLPAGSPATATITGTPTNPILNLALPAGTPGTPGNPGKDGSNATPPTLAIGQVVTLNPGTPATATLTGPDTARTLNLSIPAGQTGNDGTTPVLTIGTITTLPAATPATATLTGTNTAPKLNLGLTTGNTGPTGIAQIEYLDAIPVPGMTLTLGTATTDITITWPNPFPTNTYFIDKPQITVNSIALLGKIDAKIKSQTPTGATITITTTSLLSAGNTTISVIAYRKN